MKKILLAGLLLTSFGSAADGVTKWWNTSNVSSSVAGSYGTSNNYEEMTIVKAGVDMTITGWSDSVPGEDPLNSVTNKEKYDQTVTQAELFTWGSNNALGVVNNDENYQSNGDHAIDNGAANNNSYWADQDMVLLDFSAEVQLQKIKVTWQQTGSNNVLDVGAVAINETQLSMMQSDSYSWADIFNVNDMLMITSTYDQSTQRYSFNNQDQQSALWLVGFYGEGGDNYDAFKLLGAKATIMPVTVTEVSEPASMAMFALGLLFVARRNRKS